MRIRLKDGREFSGTARQIVSAMRSVAFDQADASLRDYVEFVRDNTQRFEGVRLDVRGDTDEELVASLLEQLERAELLERL